MEDIYVFEILDNKDPENKKTLMLYQHNDSLLTPLVEKFERGWPEFPSFENIIRFLNENNINELITYSPNDLDTICSHPYERGDFTEYEREHGACFHRFYHIEFSPSEDQAKVMKENNINIKYLSQKKISALEQSLKYHYQ